MAKLHACRILHCEDLLAEVGDTSVPRIAGRLVTRAVRREEESVNIQQRFIVPGLGVVVLLAAVGFASVGSPLWMWLLVALLGIVAIATYFAPEEAQVELGAGIAILGLVVLLLRYNSIPLWLSLVSFGAMGAFQIRRVDVLRTAPRNTITWIKELAERRGVARAPVAEDAAGDGEAAQVTAPSTLNALPGFVRLSGAGIGSAGLGVLAALSVFLPWIYLYVDVGEDGIGFSYTLLGVNETLDMGAMPIVFFSILLVLGLACIASIALPRAVAAIVAVAGFIVNFASYIYMYVQWDQVDFTFGGGLLGGGVVDWVTLPNMGSMLAGFCYTVIFLLQLIPRLNKPLFRR